MSDVASASPAPPDDGVSVHARIGQFTFYGFELEAMTRADRRAVFGGCVVLKREPYGAWTRFTAVDPRFELVPNNTGDAVPLYRIESSASVVEVGTETVTWSVTRA